MFTSQQPAYPHRQGCGVRPTADGTSGFDALKSIVTRNVIEARTAYGAARHIQRLLSHRRLSVFTETPLEHSWTMTLELAERRTSNFAPYGPMLLRKAVKAKKLRVPDREPTLHSL